MYSDFFKNKTAVVTGGSHGIGRRVCEKFAEAGAFVWSINQNSGGALPGIETFAGDVGDESVLRAFSEKVIETRGSVDFLINNAPPAMRGLRDCTYDDLMYALRVGVAAPFMLSKLFCDHFAPGAAIVNISSTRDSMSQPFTESYTAAKGGIAALTHALAMSLAGRVRVNAILPGWIDVSGSTEHSDADKRQHPAGRIGTPDDIADMVLYLCSDKAGFINGENIVIDGGMTRQMIYHGDNGWELM